MSVQKLLTANGFVNSGDIWGDAAWKRIGQNLVVSLGGACSRNSTLHNDDFLQYPEMASWPCQLRIYVGPFEAGWTVETGSLPMTPAGELPDIISRLFPTVAHALRFVQEMVS